MVFVPSLSHTSWVEQKTQQQLNKQKQTNKGMFSGAGSVSVCLGHGWFKQHSPFSV